MRIQCAQLLLACLLLLGCGSSKGGTAKNDASVPRFYPEVNPVEDHPDAPPSPGPEVDAESVPLSTCDEAVKGEHFCIINPGTSVGGGTIVARLPPTTQVSACR